MAAAISRFASTLDGLRGGYLDDAAFAAVAAADRRDGEHRNPTGNPAYFTTAYFHRPEELASVDVPALVIGAQHDTMDPAFMKMMAERLPQGRYLHCPDGSHLAMYDDQAVYFAGLIDFLHSLEG